MQIDWNKCVIIRLLANYFDVTTTAKLTLVNFELYRYLPPLTNRTCSAFSFLFILLILHDMPLNCVLNPCGGWFAVLRLPLLTNDADVVCVCVPLNNHLNLLISSEMCDNNKHGTSPLCLLHTPDYAAAGLATTNYRLQQCNNSSYDVLVVYPANWKIIPSTRIFTNS